MPLKQKELWDELHALANEYYVRRMDFDQIHDKLMEKYNDEPLVYAVVKKVKSEHYAEIRKEGLIILGIGFVLILTGFLITCANFHANQSVAFAMYGLTTAGIIVVFYGLYKIIG